MAYEVAGYALRITLVAGGDLSTKQYYFVKINSSGEAVICSGATDRPIGVLQNNPESGEEAAIVVVGGTKVVSSASIDEGALIGTSAAGKADAKLPGTDTTEYAVGTVILSAGADDEILTAVVNCASPARAA
jgi:hypothetical protein